MCSGGSPTSASLSASPTSASSSVKSEHKSRFERQKAPDRVAFVAASKEGFTRMSGASAAAGRSDGDEQKRSRLSKLADRMEVDEDGVERKRETVKLDAREREEEVEEEEEEDVLNRYKPITVPFRKQRVAASSHSASSSQYPARSAASIITNRSSTEHNPNLLFFQLPSHLPLQPSSAPLPPPVAPASSTAASSALPAKPPNLAASTAPTTSSFLAQKTLQQKKRLLTFDPQFPNSLQYVQPGLIGRLVVYKSGRVCMEVGGVRLDVQRGVDCLYHQQVVSVHAEAGGAEGVEGAEGKNSAESKDGAEGAEGAKEAGSGGGRRDWVELGDVRERLVCTMDVKDLQRKRDSRNTAGSGQMAERNDEKGVGGDVKMKEEKM